MTQLTTLADVKQYLGIKSADTANDALLTMLITAASVAIEAWCSTSFGMYSVTLRQSGSGTRIMPVDKLPIISVQRVAIGQIGSSPREIPSASSDIDGYFFDESSIRLTEGAGKFWRGIPVTVQYTAGYEQVPADIALVAIELVARKFKGRERAGKTSEQIHGESVAYSQSDFSENMIQIMRQHNRKLMVF